jgi:uncharacterized protein YggL (DUF469 family)
MSSSCPLLGFRVSMDVASGAARDAVRLAWTRFLAERGLSSTGGGGAGERLEFLVSSEASQATELDRSAATAWLGARPELRGWWVGDVHDLRPED